VTAREQQRLADILAAIDAIRAHLRRGNSPIASYLTPAGSGLLEIGEAVKALPAEMLDTQPAIPWSQDAA
jgi:uncharacterized protein with HEPN domain